MTGRIAAAFAAAKGRALLVPYLTTGWPTPAATAKLLDALAVSGADLIELGVPFSDASADGPVIQRANETALVNGVGLADALAATLAFRERGGTVPVVLMGYANPFLRFRAVRLAQQCAACGVDGVLAVDWPPGVSDGLGCALADHSVDRIVLVAPTTTDTRARAIGALGSGYAYYVSMQGVTGSAKLDIDKTIVAGTRLRGLTGLPLAVGFGIRTPEDVARLGGAFDAVIVGTRLLEVISTAGSDGATCAAKELLVPMREALA